jgi:hypothetical protein
METNSLEKETQVAEHMEKVISQLEPVWQTPTLTLRVSEGFSGTPLWGHWPKLMGYKPRPFRTAFPGYNFCLASFSTSNIDSGVQG